MIDIIAERKAYKRNDITGICWIGRDINLVDSLIKLDPVNLLLHFMNSGNFTYSIGQIATKKGPY